MGAPGGVRIRSWGQEWQPVAWALSETFWAIFTKPRLWSRILRKTPLVAMIEGFKGCGCCRHLRLSNFSLSCSWRSYIEAQTVYSQLRGGELPNMGTVNKGVNRSVGGPSWALVERLSAKSLKLCCS